MIDHKVTIGNDDVSQEVIKINTQQSLDTDSDPGKITIVLANPHQKYTNKWPPQKTPIKIIENSEKPTFIAKYKYYY